MKKIGDSLQGKRVLITQSNDFMGPALCEAFKFYEADVYSDSRALLSQSIIEEVLSTTGDIDVLVVNLAYPINNIDFDKINLLEWQSYFAHMVDPLPKLAKLVLPKMIKKQQGKIVVMGSATALNGRFGNAGYNAARGAQLSWVKKMGTDMAKYNIQINYIAQAFVDNKTFFPDNTNTKKMLEEQLQYVPSGRLAQADECTALAIFLASSESNFFVGQCFPIAGGLV
jgi:2-keto-3-deoxy-L-fuconate dehydrogenase